MIYEHFLVGMYIDKMFYIHQPMEIDQIIVIIRLIVKGVKNFRYSNIFLLIKCQNTYLDINCVVQSKSKSYNFIVST